MRKKYFVLIIMSFILFTAMKGDKKSYQLFKQNGKTTKYGDLVKDALEADVVLFGELHNNPICHWLQLELTKDLFNERGDQLLLGAEMFETDNQLLLNEYLDGTIKTKNFEDEVKLWSNYKTDYKPLVEFAKENNLKFIGTNIPRRYASLVNKKGFEGLEELRDESKNLLPPLPVLYDGGLEGYKSMLDMMGGMDMAHVNENLPKAQAIKDATMAHFILENMDSGQTFLHFNGTYHSNNFEGIVWYLKQYRPELKVLTIASVEQNQVEELNEENLDLANFILCIPEDMTKTY